MLVGSARNSTVAEIPGGVDAFRHPHVIQLYSPYLNDYLLLSFAAAPRARHREVDHPPRVLPLLRHDLHRFQRDGAAAERRLVRRGARAVGLGLGRRAVAGRASPARPPAWCGDGYADNRQPHGEVCMLTPVHAPNMVHLARRLEQTELLSIGLAVRLQRWTTRLYGTGLCRPNYDDV